MEGSTWKRLVAHALGGALVALAAVTPAQATLVVGKWDPAFGAPFLTLGWRGTTVSFVPADCLNLGPGFGVVANDGLTCSPMSVLDATVEFYDIGASPPEPTVETLDFTGDVVIDSLVLDFVTGGFLGLNIGSTGFVPSTSALAQLLPGPTQALFALELEYVGTPDPNIARLFWSSNGINDGGQGTPAVVEYRVPEPGSLALAAAALGGGLVAGRRRRRAAPPRRA